MLATGKNSPNCSEEDCINPAADNYFYLQGIYNLCSEEVAEMRLSSEQRLEICKKYAEGASSEQLGKEYGVWSSTIRMILKKAGQPRRTLSEARKGCTPWNKGKPPSEETLKKISEALKGRNVWNMGKKGCYSEEAIQKMSESHTGQTPKSPFREGNIPWNKGVKGGYSEQYIKKLSCSHKGQHSAPQTEFRRGTPQEMHPRWMGGVSFEPYCPKFNAALKERIRERDRRRCQLCPCTEGENGERLSVHHVHYDKPNCEPDLISLCRKCNSKVNSNRDYYENLFMQKLKERGLI